MGFPKRRPIAIDLYSGAGGLSLGLEQAGFDISLAVDRDPYHIATHQRNFPYGKTLCASVAELSGKDLLREIGEKEVDLICGGPPCQGFSSMGKRYAEDPRNTHVDQFARIVLEVLPKAFLMENVPGIQAGETASIFERTVKKLSPQYDMATPVRTLNAANFGVPQKRERLFLVGIRKDLSTSFTYPSEIPASERPTVWDAICDLPPLQRRDDLFQKDSSKYRRLKPKKLHPYVKRARGIDQDSTDFSHTREWNSEECSGCLRIKHRADIEALYGATAPGAVVPAHNLPRLDPRGLSPTLRAGTDSEHGSYNAPRPVHPIEPRCITVREAARLHGYPDWFRFYPRKWHAHRQIGNSVCPPVARALGACILKSLGSAPKKPDKTLKLDDAFVMPDSTNRHHKRISQLTEWPKVLDALLKKAGVGANGIVKTPSFTIADVEQAYKDSGANMQRTPAGRFLEDVARSRNRRQILAGVLKKGFSVLPSSETGAYGRFVPKGTADTLEWKNFLTVGSDEVTRAAEVRALPASENGSLVKYLERKNVFERLFESGELRIETRPHNGKVTRAHVAGSFELRTGVRPKRGIVVVGVGTELPGVSAIEALMRRSGSSHAVVMSRITKHHFAALLLGHWSGRLRERKRGIFRISSE